MELKNIIQKRKSIRNYQKKDVKSWVIGEILDSARYAPSAGNAQNWRFIVVKDKDMKNKLAEASLKQYWMNTAPVFIVVCSDDYKIEKLYGERGKLYAVQNCAVAAAYIMLKAVELDLGTCWVGAFDNEKVSKILGLSPDLTPQAIITLGYPEKDQLIKPFKRHDLDKLVYFNAYKNKILNPPKKLAEYVKDFFSRLKKTKD